MDLFKRGLVYLTIIVIVLIPMISGQNKACKYEENNNEEPCEKCIGNRQLQLIDTSIYTDDDDLDDCCLFMDSDIKRFIEDKCGPSCTKKMNNKQWGAKITFRCIEPEQEQAFSLVAAIAIPIVVVLLAVVVTVACVLVLRNRRLKRKASSERYETANHANQGSINKGYTECDPNITINGNVSESNDGEYVEIPSGYDKNASGEYNTTHDFKPTVNPVGYGYGHLPKQAAVPDKTYSRLQGTQPSTVSNNYSKVTKEADCENAARQFDVDDDKEEASTYNKLEIVNNDHVKYTAPEPQDTTDDYNRANFNT